MLPGFKPPRTETEVQKAIMEYLEANKIFHYRNNSIAVRGRRIGKLGRPDIQAIMPDGSGRYLGIEVKAQGDKQSPGQIAFMEDTRKHEGVYILAYSVEDVIGGIREATEPQAAIRVVTVVGDEACKDCREHTQWHGDRQVSAFLADLELPHPSAWYCKERILFKIKAMRARLTAAPDEGRMET